MTTPIDQARIYTDFQGFSALRRGARDDSPEALKAVAQQFEAMFIHMLLKGSRDSALAEDVLGGTGDDVAHDLYDQQMSLHLSQQRGIGIADMLVRQLGRVGHVGQVNIKTGYLTPKAASHLPPGEG